MNTYIYTAIVFLLLISGCRNKSDGPSRFTQQQIDSLHLESTEVLKAETSALTAIDLNPFLGKNHFDLDSLVKEVKLIPFETTDASLLDAIYKVIVTDSNIYVHDKFKGGSLAIFDIEGKFIRRIPIGKGPGELSRLYDIGYDKDNHELVAYQHSFLCFYTSSGKFIRQERLPFGFYNFTVTDDGYVFKALDDQQGNEHLSSNQKYTLFVTDKRFKMKAVGLPTISPIVNFGGYSYLFSSNDSIYVTERFVNDTIYQYKSATNQLKAKYVLDYGSKKLPSKYLTNTWNEIEKIVRQNDYYYNIGEYLDTENCHVFFLENQYSRKVTVFRDKRSGNMRGGNTVQYNLNELPVVLASPKGTSGSYFVTWYNPSENDLFASNSTIISAEDKQKLKGLTENDNPVLVLYTLNKF